MATSAYPAASSAPPRIQRLAGPSVGQMDSASASVDHALASPGMPLEPMLRQDMEQCFGHDFSRVRVHSGAAAEQSARAVNANAYTVGQDILFGAGLFAPGTHEGRRLIAHELTHVVQQGAEAKVIQREPDSDDDEPVVARPKSCPGGAMPYNGVCLTVDILNALPAAEGDVHIAEKIVKTNEAEKRAQTGVEKRYAKVSNADLNKKIDQIREEVKRGDKPGSTFKSLERLEKERERRRALPISTPTKVDQAIAMLEEAWSLVEKEQPPDMRRANYLVHVVNNWLQKAAPSSKYDEYFSGFSRETARQTVGYAKGLVNSLEQKLRLHASIGGWWPATINSLKMARELVQIMSGEKRIEETEFHGISKVINKTSVATPLVGAGIMAAPAVLLSGAELIPAAFETGSWAAVRAAPRVATWIGTHPFLTAELGGAALSLGEKISEGDLTPEDIAWNILTLGHAHMSDVSMMRPSGGGPSIPPPQRRAPGPVAAALALGLERADVLPGFPAGGTSVAANRSVPAVVSVPPAPAPPKAPTEIPPAVVMTRPSTGAPPTTRTGTGPTLTPTLPAPVTPAPLPTTEPTVVAPAPAVAPVRPIASTPPTLPGVITPQAPPRAPVRRVVPPPVAKVAPPVGSTATLVSGTPMKMSSDVASRAQQRIEVLANKKVIVGMQAKITVSDEPVLIGLRSAEFSKFDERRAAALGGAGRAAVLPQVPQPPRTPAKKGSQPSSGFIVQPDQQSRELEVLAWNTSAPEKGHNVSHAERQFINWFEDQDPMWKARVITIDVIVFGREICDLCAADIKTLKANHPHIKFNWVRGD